MPAAPNGLHLVIAEDYSAMSLEAARLIAGEARVHPNLLVCASGGQSWVGCYERLARTSDRNPGLFSRLRVVQVDEWGGLRQGSPATCRTQIKAQLLKPIGVASERFGGFRSDPAKPERECERMQRWLAANGPIDLCFLGLGLNGHIALNEPAAGLRPDVHVVKLTASSLKSDMLRKADRKPRYGLTLGMGDILQSRKIMMLVSGEAKRAVLKRLLEPSVSPDFPASFLWLHPAVTIVCDQAALPGSRRSA
jgi:galactosamine-6-phosphate isomerase